jgi:hypothetical protein
MERNLIIFGTIFIVICVCLMGCNGHVRDDDNGDLPDIDYPDPVNHIKIGDSVIVDDINYTFERVYNGVRFHDDFKIFTIEINGTNIGSLYRNGYVRAIKYKMVDGTKHDAPPSTNSTASFTLSPWESKKSYIYCIEDELAIDYSQIAEVYLDIGGIDRALDII